MFRQCDPDQVLVQRSKRHCSTQSLASPWRSQVFGIALIIVIIKLEFSVHEITLTPVLYFSFTNYFCRFTSDVRSILNRNREAQRQWWENNISPCLVFCIFKLFENHLSQECESVDLLGMRLPLPKAKTFSFWSIFGLVVDPKYFLGLNTQI